MSILYRMALLAYPAAYRDRHGAEIAGSAAELADSSWSLGQALSLTVGGLRTRGDRAMAAGVGPMFRSCLALYLFLITLGYAAALASSQLAPRSGNEYGNQHGFPLGTLLLGTALTVLLLFTTRWSTALLAVGTIAAPLANSGLDLASPAFVLWTCAIWITPFLYLSYRGQGARACSPKAGLLLFTVALGITLVSSDDMLALSIALAILPLITAALGLILLNVDPRPMLFGLISISFHALSFVTLGGWSLSTPPSDLAPLVVSFSAVGVLFWLTKVSVRRTTPTLR